MSELMHSLEQAMNQSDQQRAADLAANDRADQEFDSRLRRVHFCEQGKRCHDCKVETQACLRGLWGWVTYLTPCEWVCVALAVITWARW